MKRNRIFKNDEDRKLTDREFLAWIERVTSKPKNFNNKK